MPPYRRRRSIHMSQHDGQHHCSNNSNMKIKILVFLLVRALPLSFSFLATPPSARQGLFVASWRTATARRESQASSSSSDSSTTLLDELRSKTVRQLKQELVALRISTKDALEKEDLVQRLYQASRQTTTTTCTDTSTDKRQESNGNALTVPLLMSSLEHDIPVSGKNMPEQEEWTLRPTEQPYCTIIVKVHTRNGQSFPLSLLLDTACSGILLRPQVVQQHNLSVVNSPVTMTSGGGTASSNSQVTNVEFSLLQAPNRRFGPLPAVVQDIGALPKALDGIIGLSFLQQFQSIEFDFINSLVSFYETSPPAVPADWELQGRGDMYMLGSLGIYAVDTWWAGRGPVRMLVDTGAASTYWSWSGVTQDLQIPRDSPMIQKLPGFMGIMGSDNMANPLTHRVYVSSRMGLKEGSGLSLAGNKRLSVDIGDIPILQQLQSLGVGGILGLDVLRRSSVVRVQCRGNKPSISMYQVPTKD